MHRIVVNGWCALLIFAVLPVGIGRAQDRAAGEGRVLEMRELAATFPGLRKVIAVRFEGKPVEQALRDIAAKADLTLTYSNIALPKRRTVWLTADRSRADEALEKVLADAGLQLLPLSNGRFVVVPAGYKVDGQAGTIVGRVADAKTKQPLASAEVFLEKSSRRTTTDSTGWYRLAAIDVGSQVVVVRRLGYAKQTVKVTVQEGRTDTVNVALEPAPTRLEDVVTTATGRRRRVDIANDITTINADSVMQAAPIRNVTDLLETRVPGLSVQRTSGAPGDPSRLRLRGVGSLLRNNDPIVFVDGARIYAEQSAERSGNLANRGAGNQGYAAPSPLDQIDPSSIETIEVLKGPSAATLYGQDAANGVIVITTKRGRPGPARWEASVDLGRTKMPGQYPDLTLRWGEPTVGGPPMVCPVTNRLRAGLGDPVFCHGDSVVTFQLLNDPALTVLGRGHRTDLSLGVSGGSQALTYSVIGSYEDETGLMELPSYEADRYRAQFGLAPPSWMRRPHHYKRWGATSTILARLSAKADVSLTTDLSSNEQQRSSLEDQLGVLMGTYLDRPTGVYFRQLSPLETFDAVPNALVDYYQRATTTTTAFRNSAALNWRPHFWLEISSNVGLDVSQRVDQIFIPRGLRMQANSAEDTTGAVDDGQGTVLVSTVNLRALALKPIGRGFQFRFGMGANYAGTSIKDLTGGARDLPPGSSVGGARVSSLDRIERFDATFGWYVEPSIGNNKINFTSGLRLDGGRTYGGSVDGLQLPKFPKVSLSYLVSEEPFFPFKDLFQSFRVRVAYGRAGRQPGPTDRLRLYSRPTQVFSDGNTQTGVELQHLGNTEVRPERATEFEGGFDADLLDSRLTLAISGYRKTTDDMLLDVPVPPSVYGRSVTITKNIGLVRNTGVELAVGAQLIRSGPVTWTTNLGLHQNRNVLVRLAPGLAPYYTDGNENLGGLRVAAGYPLYGRWSKPILGYADANSDGILQTGEIQVGDTAVYAGATLPNREASLSTTLSLWRGALTVNATFSHQDGFSQRNEVARRLMAFSPGQQVPGTPIAEQLASVDLTGAGGSDYNWIQTVSLTRFHTLGVRYAVPVAAARRLGAQSLSIALQGRNLGLWTDYRGIDPNVNAFNTGNNVTDTGVLPQPRFWELNVRATY